MTWGNEGGEPGALQDLISDFNIKFNKYFEIHQMFSLGKGAGEKTCIQDLISNILKIDIPGS